MNPALVWQMSAQSRFNRMHASSPGLPSATHASAQVVHTAAHSLQAAMQSASDAVAALLALGC